MRVEVLVNGIHRDRYVKRRVALELRAGATLRDLVREAREHAALDLLDLEGPGTVSMLAGRRVDLHADARTALHEGDLLALLSPLGGG